MITVRTAAPEDFASLVPLLKTFASVRDAGLEERYAATLRHRDFVLFVAEREGRVVGYALAQGYGPRLRSGEESVRLHDLAVAKTERRQGAGRALFDAVRTWTRARGSRYLEWRSSSEGAAFYEALGFKGDGCPQPHHPFFEIAFEPD